MGGGKGMDQFLSVQLNRPIFAKYDRTVIALYDQIEYKTYGREGVGVWGGGGGRKRERI